MDNDYNRIVDLYKLSGEHKTLLKVFYTNDYPIPFKELTLYPVKVSMLYLYTIFSECLKVPHLTSGDLKALSMSYLKYIYYLATEKNQKELFYQLERLLLMILELDKTYIDGNKQEQNTIDFLLNTGEIRIKGVKYTSEDFDTIREIILNQNGEDLPDETINPEVLQAYKQKQELELKSLNYKLCDLEDNINILVCMTSYKRNEILNLTIRTFYKLLERSGLIMNYKILNLLSPNMEEKDRKKIVPYNADIGKSLKQKVRESFSTLDDLQKKVGGT